MAPLPANLTADDRVVLFDAECKFCNGWSKFLIERDPTGALRLAACQSRTGQSILAWAGMSITNFNTMAFVEGGTIYTHSDAFLRVMRHLPWPWRLLAWLIVVPRAVRDSIYVVVARNRYRWFGRQEQCLMPVPSVRARFLP